MPTNRAHVAPRLSALFGGVLLLAAATRAAAMCNAIPGPLGTFTSVVGVINQPFASPGESLRLTLDTDCHPLGSTFPTSEADLMVTVSYRPALVAGSPTAGAAPPAQMAVLAEGCRPNGPLAQLVRSCGLEHTVCIEADRPGAAPDLLVPTSHQELQFRFPEARICVGGLAAGQVCTDDAECRGGTCGGDSAGGGGFTLTGPAAIAVVRVGDGAGIPSCDFLEALRAEPCDSLAAAGNPDLLACVDRLSPNDGTACEIAPHDTFPHFVALPFTNDFRALAPNPFTDPHPPRADVRFTVDRDGNVLVPMSWLGVESGMTRAMHFSTNMEAFEGGGVPIGIPDSGYLGSYTPGGRRLTPPFDPQRISRRAQLVVFGTADADRSILRIARRPSQCRPDGSACATDCVDGLCPRNTCTGGAFPGSACSVDDDCGSDQRCEPELFDFASRRYAGVGPVVLRPRTCLGGTNAGGMCRPNGSCANHPCCPGGQCTEFAAAADEKLSLSGLVETPRLRAFVVSEPHSAVDFNDDGDRSDDVLIIRERSSGANVDFGHPVECGSRRPQGRAVVRAPFRSATTPVAGEPPFAFPAFSLDGDLVTLLESEPGESAHGKEECDENHDHDAFDAILRIFRLDLPNLRADELTSHAVAVDAAPLVNDRSFAVSTDPASSHTFVFVRRAENAGTNQHLTRVSVAADGRRPNGHSYVGAVSRDGRFVAFVSEATNLTSDRDTNGVADVYLRDRDADGDGVFDNAPPSVPSTFRISVGPDGEELETPSSQPVISADGRFVAFTNAGSEVDGYGWRVFLRDRGVPCEQSDPTACAATTTLVAEPASELAMSADASVIAYRNAGIWVTDGDQRAQLAESWGTSPALDAAGDVAAFIDMTPATHELNVYAYDRRTREKALLSRRIDNGHLPGLNEHLTISDDGRYVGFANFGGFLLRGASGYHYVYDRLTARLESLPLTPAHRVASATGGHWLSPDGRYAVYGDALVDRFTGLATWIGRNNNGDDIRGSVIGSYALADAGRYLVFDTDARNAVDGDADQWSDVFVRGPDPNDLSQDLTANKQVTETVLQVFDASATAAPSVGPACPATQVVVNEGTAVFLRPESGGDAPDCPRLVGASLNDDADGDDEVVHLWRAGHVDNLGLAATAVALGDGFIAALVSEAGEGRDLNGDFDVDDQVVMVHPFSGGDWTPLGQAADSLVAVGSVVAFTTAESAQGADLNGDGDTTDRVVQVYDAATGQPLTCHAGAGTSCRAGIRTAGEQLAVGGGGPQREIVAFRSREKGSLEVLQAFDVATGRLVSSHALARPCDREACDPRQPYRVAVNTVAFLSPAVDSFSSLVVLRQFNVREAAAAADDGGSSPPASGAFRCQVDHTQPYPLGSAIAAICVDSGKACANDDDCPGSQCSFKNGICVRRLGSGCSPVQCSADPQQCTCGAAMICDPNPGGSDGICAVAEGACASDSECDGWPCRSRRLPGAQDPLDGGSSVPGFGSVGRCIETVAHAAGSTCPLGTFLARNGDCERDLGLCLPDVECPLGARCEPERVSTTISDVDGDEVPDAFDNCVNVPNPDQRDEDEDCVGDACATDHALCPATPRADCESPAAEGSRFKLKNEALPRFTWWWRSAGPMPIDRFGDPRRDANYALCVYDASSPTELLTAFDVPAESRCPSPRPQCWKVGKQGFDYRQRDRVPVAVASLSVRAPGTRPMTLKLRGRLGTSAPASVAGPVTVQLTNRANGACWTATLPR